MGVYLRVNEPVAVTGVSLNYSTYRFSNVGQTLQLIATVSPADADNKNVTWSSNNEKFTVDQNGLVTSAINFGAANITVTTEDGGYTATCRVFIGK